MKINTEKSLWWNVKDSLKEIWPFTTLNFRSNLIAYGLDEVVRYVITRCLIDYTCFTLIYAKLLTTLMKLQRSLVVNICVKISCIVGWRSNYESYRSWTRSLIPLLYSQVKQKFHDDSHSRRSYWPIYSIHLRTAHTNVYCVITVLCVT